MKTKITQREWQNIVVGSPNGFFHKVISDTESICNITTRDSERAIANAKLISASPELLESIICLVHNAGLIKLINEAKGSLLEEHYNECLSAIKKATE